MSGGVKSGLLFALAAILVVAAISFVPTIGLLCCGPLGVLLLGGAAGYVGVRWSGPSAGIGQGVLAGALTGGGALIGSIIFFVIALGLVRAIPELNEQIQQQIEEAMRQQGGGALTAEELDLFLNLGGGLAGFCLGTINLVFALGAGALGGWLAVRQRAGQQPPSQPPIAMPPAVG